MEDDRIYHALLNLYMAALLGLDVPLYTRSFCRDNPQVKAQPIEEKVSKMSAAREKRKKKNQTRLKHWTGATLKEKVGEQIPI